MNKAFSFVSLLALASLVACGGQSVSGPGTSIVPTSAPTGNNSETGSTVSFLVVVPAATQTTSASKRPAFVVPSGSQSATFTLTSVNGVATTNPTPTVAQLNSSNGNCESVNGQFACTVNVTAPVGDLVFKVATYGNTTGAGTATSEGMVSVTTTAGQTATVSTTIGGTVAKIAIALSATTLEVGNSGSVQVIVNAMDASGVTIIGAYSTPITLTDTDASNQTSLSSTTPISSSTAASGITLSYAGGTMPSAATISATASGVSAITPATFQADATAPTVNDASTTFAYSETYSQNGGSPNTYAGTYTANVTTGQSFGGAGNLIAVTGLMAPNANSPLEIGSDDTTYFAWSAQESTATLGYVGVNDVDDDSTITCEAPYSAQLVLPFPAVNSGWNVLAGSGTCNYAYNVNNAPDFMASETTAFASDGSYSDVGTYNYTFCCVGDFGTYNETSQSNGSAAITEDQGTGSYILTIPMPSPGSSIVSATIQTFPGAIPSPGATGTPAPVTTTAPNPWVAAGAPGGAPPSPLISDTFVNKGSVAAAALPAQCAVSASILGSQPSLSEADENVIQGDPMSDWYQGLYITIAIKHYYLDGVGEICNENVETDFGFDGGVLQWYNGGDQTLDTETATMWTYVTTTSLTATAARVRSFAQALPATTQAFTAASYALIHARMQGLHKGKAALSNHHRPPSSSSRIK